MDFGVKTINVLLNGYFLFFSLAFLGYRPYGSIFTFTIFKKILNVVVKVKVGSIRDQGVKYIICYGFILQTVGEESAKRAKAQT